MNPQPRRHVARKSAELQYESLSDPKALTHWLPMTETQWLGSLFSNQVPHTSAYVLFLCWVVMEYLGTDAITGLEIHSQKPSPNLIFEEKRKGVRHRAPWETLWGFV